MNEKIYFHERKDLCSRTEIFIFMKNNSQAVVELLMTG